MGSHLRLGHLRYNQIFFAYHLYYETTQDLLLVIAHFITTEVFVTIVTMIFALNIVMT